MGGLWEFPGGKIEAGESVQQALLRELREEVNIHCTRFENLIRIEHRYPDKHVVLDVQLVDAFTGEAAGKEGQEIKWVRVDDLENYTFPEANKPIITAVKLPRRFLITGQCLDINDFRSRLADAIGSGIKYAQVRAPWLSEEEYIALANTISSAFDNIDLNFFANTSPEVFAKTPFSNLHLNSKILQKIQSRSQLPTHKLLSAACHSLDELIFAEKLGVDFVFYSPVKETASHPGCEPAGWHALAEICRTAKIPVYALGGMDEKDLSQAISCGAQGIAAITAFW